MVGGASVRTSVPLPVVLADGRQVSAQAVSFRGICDGREHLALLFEAPQGRVEHAPVVRLHSECLTGDALGSARCDCGPQLRSAIETIAACGGVLIYLRQEGRDIGLYNKLDAYSLQDRGLDTFAANHALSFAHDPREYANAADILIALGQTRIRLLTNNPDKVRQLRDNGIEVVEVVPTDVHVSRHNLHYLRAKRRRGHTISLPEDEREVSSKA